VVNFLDGGIDFVWRGRYIQQHDKFIAAYAADLLLQMQTRTACRPSELMKWF
jgi:hypothetical protein